MHELLFLDQLHVGYGDGAGNRSWIRQFGSGYYDSAQAAAPSTRPTADELTARGSLPELRLELHVWSNKPQERFVFVNGRRYREGETTAEGATLEEITRDGVVMSAGGNRFLLSRD